MDFKDKIEAKNAVGRYSKWFSSQRKNQQIRHIDPSKQLAYNYLEKKNISRRESVTKRSTYRAKPWIK